MRLQDCFDNFHETQRRWERSQDNEEYIYGVNESKNMISDVKENLVHSDHVKKELDKNLFCHLTFLMITVRQSSEILNIFGELKDKI